MKIAFFELELWERDYVKQKISNHELKLTDGYLGSKNIGDAADAEILGVFIFSKIGERELEKMPKLRCIVTMSTGFDHIDIEECAKRNIVVCNVPHYGENTVAEHTFALLLAISRKLVLSHDRTKQSNFDQEGLRGFDLKGKKLGIIGTGSIGRHVIRMARAFEMDVIASDPFPNKSLEHSMGFMYVSFEDLLAQSDIITLHAPLMQKTKHMIDAAAIEKMKDGVVIINTARGALMDTAALVDGLKSGKIGGAGIDVFEEEGTIKEEKQILSKHFSQRCDLNTLLQQHMLLTLPNVVVTPHNAFNSNEALIRILDTTIENINAFATGKPSNVVGKK